MKQHIRFTFGLAVLAGVSLVTPALAVVNIAWVPVGNAGNTADPSTGYGSVASAYNIGKYEVTNSQYAEFLNAKGGSNSNGIYNSGMASYGIAQTGSSGSYSYSVTGGLENRPVVYVSWYDAARFTNWLGNGQGTGDMETGAYTLSGNTGIITVNSGATVYLPSENEWYKAAYYNGGTSTYSLYPNGQNTITTVDANYGSSGSTNVGSYGGDPSSYGTFDQGGNVWEWNDAVNSGASRGRRGGSWYDDYYSLQSSNRGGDDPSIEGTNVGFRVASVPEPASVVLAMVASGMLLIRRKR
ncbi:MAG: SUMF1/EgtB/PvdO family nonheme iron enzyme [Verrucomicrobia bacterium]|nr:SUMF1/EgtB/PvdO family nonheme iron enzyme [Verrucomicrobiota bacterium]